MAAEYLVEQIRVSQEEKTTLINDNQTMAVQVQDLHLELENLRGELKLFNLARETSVQDDSVQGSASMNTSKLVTRVQELEDLVQEYKNQSAPQDTLHLKEIIAKQSTQI